MRDHVGVRLDLLDQPLRLQPLDDPLAHRESILPMQPQRLIEFGRRRQVGEELLVVDQAQACLDIEDADLAQVVALADLEIVEVVAGRHLDGAGPLLGIGVFVGEDRDAAADQRQHGAPPDQVAVARVVRMDRHGGVAEHRLGPRRGDRYVRIVKVFDRIFNVP